MKSCINVFPVCWKQLLSTFAKVEPSVVRAIPLILVLKSALVSPRLSRLITKLWNSEHKHAPLHLPHSLGQFNPFNVENRNLSPTARQQKTFVLTSSETFILLFCSPLLFFATGHLRGSSTQTRTYHSCLLSVKENTPIPRRSSDMERPRQCF